MKNINLYINREGSISIEHESKDDLLKSSTFINIQTLRDIKK